MPKRSTTKSTPISLQNGRIVSKRSKTGDPACSSAMSTWVRARHGGPPAGPDVFAMLAKCRQKAAQNRRASAQQTSGKLAPGRGTWQRSEKAQQLQAARHQLLSDTAREGIQQSYLPRPSIRQQADARRSRKGSPLERLELARQLRAERNPAPTPAAPSLRDQAAKHRAERGLDSAQRLELATARRAARAKYPAGATPQRAEHPTGKAFSDRVMSAAASVGPEGRYGDNKVFINHAHRAYEQAHGPIPRDEFNRRLAAELQAGRMPLSRADMIEAMNRADVEASALHSNHALFNFIRLPATSRAVEPPTNRPAAAAPSLRDQADAARAAKGSLPERAKAFQQKIQKRFNVSARQEQSKRAEAVQQAKRAQDARAQSDALQYPHQKAVLDSIARTEAAESQSLSREADKRGRTVERIKRRASAINRLLEGIAAGPKAPAAPIAAPSPAPSLRDQAAKHRATKGTREERLHSIAGRYGKLAKYAAQLDNSDSIRKSDFYLDRRRRAQLAAEKPEAKPFSLRRSAAESKVFSSAGGSTQSLFGSDRGAAARDLPGQSSFLDGVGKPRAGQLAARIKSSQARYKALLATAKTKKVDARRLMRGIPPISGGSPAAVLEASNRRAAHRERKARALARQRREVNESRTSSVRDVSPDKIHFDPERFQYKLAHAEGTGSVGSLAGVRKWDSELGGVLQVWKDPSNGRTYVVNGHNRLDLARRLNAEKVSVRFIRAKDATEARTTGALTNIAEGRGTATDAAAFFRDTGLSVDDLKGRGIPLRERTATEGLALAGLEPSLWKQHVNGDLPTERAAIIGGSGLTHAEQAAVAKTAGPGGLATLGNRQLREYIDNAKAAGSATRRTASLFGDDEEAVNLGAHRAKVQASIKERLSREKRVFGTVAKSRNAADLQREGNTIDSERSGAVSRSAAENLHVFDMLKNRRGPVATLLNDAAERIHNGESQKVVSDDVYKRLPAAIREALDGS